MGRLYYGDNLQVLREHIATETVDLVYLDPPFNSNANYNILFKSPTGERSEAQVEAFEDTWHWNEHAETAFDEVIRSGNSNAADMLRAMRSFLGENDMMAYLAMIAVRLIELHRVLKETGSLYLHCDPTASHYLKILLDAVFGPDHFRNEIVWKRSHPKGHAFTRFATNHDTILSYVKTVGSAIWNPIYAPHDPDAAERQYSLIDPDGRRYQLTSLLNPNSDRPNLTYEFLGVTRVWRWTKERMEAAHAAGQIVAPRGGKGIPRFKRYLDEQEGIPVGDFWGDIPIAAGSERLGYPTQKPVSLMERILKASSNEGDVVLDPFCGCGTTVHAAEKLNREWIGIDVTHLSIALIERRLKDAFPDIDFDVIGTPKDLQAARDLAERNKYQFQWWAVSLVGAVPYQNKKKGSDKGIDGYVYFRPDGKTAERAIVSVKGGEKVSSPMIRDLKGVIEREKSPIGIFISLAEPTRDMISEAASAGFYMTEHGQYPRIQLFTIAELLDGKMPRIPFGYSEGYRKAAREEESKQGLLL